jgi:hypothetical protein
MPIQVLINQPGPLPIVANFKAPGNESMYLQVNGSVWSQNENRTIGILIEIDGKMVGAAQIFSNGAATHRAVVPAFIPIQLAFGEHSISLSPTVGSVSDSNDFYTAAIHY